MTQPRILSTVTISDALAMMPPMTAGEGRVTRQEYTPAEEVLSGWKVSMKLLVRLSKRMPVLCATVLPPGSLHWTEGLPVRPATFSVTVQRSVSSSPATEDPDVVTATEMAFGGTEGERRHQ